jgi:hypothetical protein
MVGVDIARRYGAGHGGTIRNIGSSRQLLAGTIIDGDAGDLSAGGFLRPTAVRVDDTAQIWADRAVVRMKAGELAWVAAEATSAIHMRDCAPTGQPNFGPGLFDTY